MTDFQRIFIVGVNMSGSTVTELTKMVTVSSATVWKVTTAESFTMLSFIEKLSLENYFFWAQVFKNFWIVLKHHFLQWIIFCSISNHCTMCNFFKKLIKLLRSIQSKRLWYICDLHWFRIKMCVYKTKKKILWNTILFSVLLFFYIVKDFLLQGSQ